MPDGRAQEGIRTALVIIVVRTIDLVSQCACVLRQIVAHTWSLGIVAIVLAHEE